MTFEEWLRGHQMERAAGGYSIKAFGAKGDGVTDDTVPILNALNAANMVGAWVFVPHGTFVVGYMLLDGNFRMFGPGTLKMSGVIELPDDATAIECHDVTMVKSVDGAGVLHPSTGNVLNYVDVRGVKVSGGFGFHLNAGASNVNFEGNKFTDLAAQTTSLQALRIGNNNYTASLSSRNIRIYGNVVDGVVNAGGAETHAFLVYGQDITIFGNTIAGVENADNTGCEAIYTKGVGVSIFGNTIKDCAVSNDGHITVKGTDIGETDAPNGARSTISNNAITNDDVSDTPIGISVNTDDCVVTGNLLVNCGARVKSCSGVQFTGNHVNINRSGALHCFEIDSASDIDFDGNHFHLVARNTDDNTLTGSRIRNTESEPMNGIRIRGGHFVVEYPDLTTGANCVSPFHIWADDGDITGVVIEGVETSVIAPGIAGDSDRNLVNLSGNNDIEIAVLRNRFDGSRIMRNSVAGTLTLEAEGNRLPVQQVTTDNMGLSAEQTDIAVHNSGATAVHDVILPDGAMHGHVFKVRATDENYGMNISIPAAATDTFTDGSTSHALPVGDSADVRCYTPGLWHVTG